MANWADWNLQFSGINYGALTDDLTKAMNKVKSRKVKDPFFGLVVGDLARALTAPPLYSENDLRNKAIDLRQSIIRGWLPEQRRLEDWAIARGMVDSGATSRMLGEALAKRENAIKSGISNIFLEGAQANEQYKQQQLAQAMNELFQYWLNKKQRQKMRQSLQDALTQLQAQSSSMGLQDWFGLGSALAGLFV